MRNSHNHVNRLIICVISGCSLALCLSNLIEILTCASRITQTQLARSHIERTRSRICRNRQLTKGNFLSTKNSLSLGLFRCKSCSILLQNSLLGNSKLKIFSRSDTLFNEIVLIQRNIIASL